MKRVLPLLLALVMTLALAAPALAAEDVFAAFDTEEAAPEAPIAPEAPVEEVPVEEAPAEAPDMPLPAAAEPEDMAPEDTEPAPGDAHTGTLTILGEIDKLWFVAVENDAGDETDYVGDYDSITLQDGDEVALIMDYRYTIQWDGDWQPEGTYGELNDRAPGGVHTGDVCNMVSFGINSEGGCDTTITIVEDPNAPKAVPVTWTAPEGVQVKANGLALLLPDYYGTFTCDADYVPAFIGAKPQAFRAMDDGSVMTYFTPNEGAQSIQIDVRKATGYLNITGLVDKVVEIEMGDVKTGARADAYNGLVGGMLLAVGVEADCDIKTDVEPYNDIYFEYEGEPVHAYGFIVPADGDINMEIVKTQSPIEPPKSGTGWVYDEATGDYYYFVDGEQKSDYWVCSQWGLWYYLMPDGRMATGFQYVQNSNGTGWYMFQTDNDDGCIGRMLTGWQWTYTDAGMGWFNTAHGGLNGQCTYTTAWGAYNAATGMWADGLSHRAAG